MRNTALASMNTGPVPMNHWPKPWRWRPVQMLCWLLPMGRRWM